MNERIKELAEQASKDSVDGYPVTLEYTKRFAEKFAELIVQKCIQMVETEASQYAEPVWAFELVNDMYEQFGIKQ